MKDGSPRADGGTSKGQPVYMLRALGWEGRSGAQGPLSASPAGPRPGKLKPCAPLAFLRTSLTSCTFRSSREGSSTIPGIMAVAATPRRCPLPRLPRLLELPFRTRRPASVCACVTAAARRRTALPNHKPRSLRKAGKVPFPRGRGFFSAPPIPPGCHGEAGCAESQVSQRLEARGRRHGVHGEPIYWGICRWQVRASFDSLRP